MRRLLPLLLLLLCLPASAGLFDPRPSAELGAPLNNSHDFLPVAEAFVPSLVERTASAVKLRFVNAEGYYLYRHRFSVKSEPAGIALGELQLPAGKHKQDEYFGDVEVYYGVLDLELPLPPGNDQAFTLLLTYQGCADKGLCYPPETARLPIPADAGSIPATTDATSDNAPTDSSATQTALN